MFNKSKAASASSNIAVHASLSRAKARTTALQEPPKMFEKILTANRGDQLPTGSTAAQPNRATAASRECNFIAEIKNV